MSLVFTAEIVLVPGMLLLIKAVAMPLEFDGKDGWVIAFPLPLACTSTFFPDTVFPNVSLKVTVIVDESELFAAIDEGLIDNVD